MFNLNYCIAGNQLGHNPHHQIYFLLLFVVSLSLFSHSFISFSSNFADAMDMNNLRKRRRAAKRRRRRRKELNEIRNFKRAIVHNRHFSFISRRVNMPITCSLNIIQQLIIRVQQLHRFYPINLFKYSVQLSQHQPSGQCKQSINNFKLMQRQSNGTKKKRQQQQQQQQ